MALVAGLHKAPWRYDAYRAIGRDGTQNGGGGNEGCLCARYQQHDFI